MQGCDVREKEHCPLAPIVLEFRVKVAGKSTMHR